MLLDSSQVPLSFSLLLTSWTFILTGLFSKHITDNCLLPLWTPIGNRCLLDILFVLWFDCEMSPCTHSGTVWEGCSVFRERNLSGINESGGQALRLYRLASLADCDQAVCHTCHHSCRGCSCVFPTMIGCHTANKPFLPSFALIIVSSSKESEKDFPVHPRRDEELCCGGGAWTIWYTCRVSSSSESLLPCASYLVIGL